MPSTIENLGAWAHALQLCDVPSGVVAHARLQHLSMAGTLRQLSTTPTAKLLRRAGGRRGKALVAGTGTAPVRDAVRLHVGLAGHLCLDDQLLLGHATGAGVAASWALAKGHTVDEVLVATIAANEIAGRVGASLLLGGPSADAQASVSACAAAVATALLEGLGPDGVARAIALALTMGEPAAGAGVPDGAAALALERAAPAVHGVESARLAKGKDPAPLGILDDDTFFGPRTPLALRPAFTGLGVSWFTATMAYKLIPASTFVQTPVQAVWEILRRHIKAADKRLRVDQVERVEVWVSAPAHRFDRGALASLDAASVPFSIAASVGVLVAAHDLSAEVLADEWLSSNEADIQAIASRVNVLHDPGRTAMTFAPVVQSLAPLFAEVEPARLVQMLRSAVPAKDRARRAVDAKMLRHVLEARVDRAYAAVRSAVPDLGTARLGEFEFRADTEVRLHTTRGGVWPERRLGPEGAPGWSWQDSRARVLARLGDGAELLFTVDQGADAEGWVKSLLH